MDLELEGNCAVADDVNSSVEVRFEPAARGGQNCDEVTVNVRFHPDGAVNSIDALPRQFSRQEWFYRLCRAEASKYEVFAGGRGRFRIDRTGFEALSNPYPN